jgi:hypothetical protein
VECARLIGVHIQSARNRETEINIPKDEQKAKILSLRKLGEDLEPQEAGSTGSQRDVGGVGKKGFFQCRNCPVELRKLLVSI